jgi:outer membrane protein
VILKYAQDNSLALIVDTSNPWPQGPVLWYGPSVDITKAVVDAYNVQSGVPAPAASSTPAAPSASRPATTAPARKPATTTPTAPPK